MIAQIQYGYREGLRTPPHDILYKVVNGVVRRTEITRKGTLVVKQLYVAGDYIMDTGPLDELRAWSDVVLEAHGRSTIDYKYLADNLDKQLKRTTELAFSIHSQEADERVLALLQFLSSYPSMKTKGGSIRTTHKELAEVLCYARETVSLALIRLEEEGYVLKGQGSIKLLSRT